MPIENHIIEACLQNDRRAQKQLYEYFSGKLFVVAMRYMKNRESAEDVLQESFVKVFRHLDTFRFDCPIEAWLRKIVVNTALKALKKNANWALSLEGDFMIEESLHYSNEGFNELGYQELMAMIHDLPDGSRTIFNLYAIEGFKHHEIAELLGISEGTSKSQYSRAKSLLQDKLATEQLKKALAFADNTAEIKTKR